MSPHSSGRRAREGSGGRSVEPGVWWWTGGSDHGSGGEGCVSGGGAGGGAVMVVGMVLHRQEAPTANYSLQLYYVQKCY